jgi:acyl-CoA thioesterase-2
MAEPTPLAALLRALELEALGDGDTGEIFVGDPGPGDGRLFGGTVAAQGVVAASRTVDGDRRLHSLHGYFLRPGRHGAPIRLVVDRLRDGRTYTTRRVKAEQRGEVVFNLSASFAHPESGIEHQEPMPEVPGPEGLPDRDELLARRLGRPRFPSAVEIRLGDTHWLDLAEGERAQPRQANWVRVAGRLPDDETIHTAVLVYATDRGLLSTAALPHRYDWRRGMAASLDHAVWIHRPVRFDDWLLFASTSPVAHGSRGLIFGGVFDRTGRRIASLAQEAVIRP